MTKSVEINVHDFDRQLNGSWLRIKKECSSENIKIIKKYDTEMIREGLAKPTRHKQLYSILNLTRMIQKDWNKVTKDDINEIVTKIMDTYGTSNGKETNTSYDYKKILRIFFRFIKLGSRSIKEVGDPEETRTIRPKPVKDTVIREDLITEEDLKKLLTACAENQRDRAFLYVIYESGSRAGEILTLKIKHLKFDKVGANIVVDGKTGSRPIRLIESVPDLAKWLSDHPFKDNPESPLWIMFQQGKYGLPMTYDAARHMLLRRSEKAGIKKRVYLHLFRHSEATRTAQFMTESQLRKRHGWSKNSTMPGKYVHMVNADVENAILQHYGIQNDNKNKANLPKTCVVCKFINPYGSSTCSQCGKPLDMQAAMKQDEVIESQQDEMERLRHRIEALESKL